MVPVENGTRRQRGDVAPGVGLREPLAPDLLSRENSREMGLLLLLRSNRNDRRPNQREAKDVDQGWRFGSRPFLLEDGLLDQLRAAPSIGSRPGESRPPGGVDFLLPSAQILEVGPLTFFLCQHRPIGKWGRHVLRQPAPQLIPKLPLLWCQTKIHRQAPSRDQLASFAVDATVRSGWGGCGRTDSQSSSATSRTRTGRSPR